MCNEMACCTAYCIGATSGNIEEIANQIPEDMVLRCIGMIRDKVKDSETDISFRKYNYILYVNT